MFKLFKRNGYRRNFIVRPIHSHETDCKKYYIECAGEMNQPHIYKTYVRNDNTDVTFMWFKSSTVINFVQGENNEINVNRYDH